MNSTRGRAPSRGKIRTPRVQTMGTQLDQMWDRLVVSLKEILNHKTHTLLFEENYRWCHNLVLHKRGGKLYSGFTQIVADHLAQQASQIIAPTFPRSTAGGPAGASSGLLSAAASSGAGVDMSAVERAMEGEIFLKALRNVWDDHSNCMAKMEAVLRYMDRVYVPTACVPTIKEAGYTLFRDHVIRSTVHPIKAQLVATLLAQIRIERDGEVINRSAMREATGVLLALADKDAAPKGPSVYADKDVDKVAFPNGPSVYEVEFERTFLAWTADFYKEEGERLVEDCPAGVYLKKVERRFEEEAARTQHYLSSKTAPPLQALLEDHLLTAHLKTLIDNTDSGLFPMLEADRIDDLARLYRLFARVPMGMKELKRGLKESVRERGDKVNDGEQQQETTVEPKETDAAGPSETTVTANEAGGDEDVTGAPAVEGGGSSKGKGKAKAGGGAGGGGTISPAGAALVAALRWVQDVLTLKDKFDRILKDAFGGDKYIQTAINEAFESFINANPRSAEFISLYIDDNLKKGVKGKTEEEVDNILDKTIILFRFLTNKDLFERYYKNHLGKRLLTGRSVSDDAEKGMVAKLKIECGYQFTKNLEGMFRDMELSSDMMNEYRSRVSESSTPPPFELSVNVLTQTNWPGNPFTPGTLYPPLLADAIASFEKFYFKKHTGRLLTWQPNQGSADVKVRFKTRAHELNVSTFALIVLLLFEELEENEEISYTDIRDSTGIPVPDLQRTLQSLACGKYRILTKFPKGREIGESDSFCFNTDFKSPLAKIKIAMVANKVETSKERAETVEKVEEDRSYLTEACIVRIMKDRKTMKHAELMIEVTRQLAPRFDPNPAKIKKRIEALIEREYLERPPGDMRTYMYLA